MQPVQLTAISPPPSLSLCRSRRWAVGGGAHCRLGVRCNLSPLSMQINFDEFAAMMLQAAEGRSSDEQEDDWKVGLLGEG